MKNLQNLSYLLFLIFFACHQHPNLSTDKQKNDQDNKANSSIKESKNILQSPSIIAEPIPSESIPLPKVVPLKGKPKTVPAHPNIHLAGQPKVHKIPKELTVLTPGKNGIPPLRTIPAVGEIVPAKYKKATPARSARYKYDAIYDVQYLTDEQGLACPPGNVILEDSRGYLWFAGCGIGVTLYDGTHFFQFSEEEGLLSNYVNEIIEDSKGNIWFATWDGVCYYNGKDFIHFKKQEVLDSPYGSTTIMEDSKGNIWFSNDGVYRYDGEKFTIFQWRTDDDIFKNYVNAIVEDNKGQYWFGTYHNGVFCYDGKNYTHYTEKEGLIHNSIGSIIEDSKGQIWFGSSGEGVIGRGVSCYKPGQTGTQATFTNFTTTEGLSDNRIEQMLEDKQGNIWLATFAGGVNRFDGEYFTHLTTREGLNLNSVNGMGMDSEDNLWLGLNNYAGANRYNPNGFIHFSEKEGLSKNRVTTIFEDSQGNLWLGTLYGGVMMYDGINFTYYNQENGFSDHTVWSITEDNNSHLWFGTRDNWVCRFDGTKFISYTDYHSKKGRAFKEVFVTHADQLGRIWLSHNQYGLYRFNPSVDDINGDFVQFIDKREKPFELNRILEDKHGDLWFVGIGGIGKYNYQADKIDFLFQEEGLEEEIYTIFEDSRGNLWFGCEGSIFYLDRSINAPKGKLTQFTKEDNPFFDNGFFDILEDNQHHIWLSTYKGIYLLAEGVDKPTFEKSRLFHFNKSDGLKSYNMNMKCAIIDSKNRLWWSTADKGLTMFDLNNFEVPTKAPQNLSLSQIDLQQQFIDFSRLSDSTYRHTLAFGTALKSATDSVVQFYNYPNTLSLPYDLNHLTFHFSAIDWAAPHKLQYSYYLDGLEKDWSPLTSEPKADYRNIPYGNYTLRVKAIGAAHKWSEPFDYSFTILPPWWHTWWARALLFLLCLDILYLIRHHELQKQYKKLEREKAFNRQLRTINEANEKFVPRDFLQVLGKTSITELQLGDQTAIKMTILFVDIRDYTTMSETMTPDENFNFINAFLGRLGPIIKRNGGFICQYFGDGLMALFKEKHEKAIKTAIEMQQTIARYNRQRQEQNRPTIQAGIGLNTGQLMLGVIGDKNRFDSSVISDAVNTASRMEGLTKIFGCSVIVSEKTLQELALRGNFSLSKKLDDEKLLDNRKLSSNPNYAYRFLGKVKVKGKDRALAIYDFYDGDPVKIQQLKTQTKTDFEKALHFYFDKDFGKAADLLKTVLEKYPNDKAATYYFDKALQFVINGVEESWSGVEEMFSK